MSSTTKGSRGIGLIRRFINGEDLDPAEMNSMRATMYLLAQYSAPARDWGGFEWKGIDHFIEEIWPEVEGRQDVRYGFFGDGLKSP